MSGLIVVKKSILEDVQDSLIDVFNKAAQSSDPVASKGLEMAELATKIFQYEEQISAKKGGTVNQSVLSDVQSKLLTQFNLTAASLVSSPEITHAAAELSGQILKYEQKLAQQASALPGLKGSSLFSGIDPRPQ